jgi:hypothetical protein
MKSIDRPSVLLLAALPLVLMASLHSAPELESPVVDTSSWEVRDPRGEALVPLEVRFMVRGMFFAGSALRDRKALGGFGGSENEPRRLRYELPRGHVLLIARPEQRVAWADRYEGLEVVLANTTRGTVWFEASDSRLSIVREARDAEGRWRPVEYLPSSFCGNSYHRVALPPDHYWSFAAPRYSGTVATVMRFVLLDAGRGEPLYSNEFDGWVNPEQFLVKQGHTPTGIMDPYLE